MSKYTKQTAAFKAITIDATQLNSKQLNAEKLNAKNILVETGYNQQSDIVSYIKEKDNEVSSKFVESTYTVEKDGGNSGNVVLFIVPCDAYPQNVPFSRMSIPVTSGVPQMETGGETTPVYLGVIQWNADGTKEIYGISDNQVTCNKFSTATWNFDTKPIVFTNDYRLIFYFIVNKEDFTTTEPTVYKDKIKITTSLHKTLDNLDPYISDENWNRALTDLRIGWLCNDSLQRNSSYPNWPACTFTTSKLTQLFQTSDSFIKNTDEDWVTIQSEIVTGPIITHTHTTNIGGGTNATEGTGAQISKDHYIPGGTTIKEVSAYWSEGAGGSFTDAYCHINVYDSSENIIKQMISTSTASRNTGVTSGTNTWVFAGDDTTTLPQDYRYVVIKVSNETVPNDSKAGAKVQWSVANINNTSSHQSFNDDCKFIGAGGGGNYLCIVDTIYTQKGDTLPERVSALENKDYDYLLTEVNTNISNIQSTVNTHTNQIGQLDQKVTNNINSIQNQINDLDQGLEGVTNNLTAHIGDVTHLTEEQRTLLSEFKENKDNYINLENQNIDYAIETGVSDTNWYRIYKSGWVEQGGVTTTGSSGTTERTVTLPVELKTSNYFVQLTQTGYYNSTYSQQVKDLTVTNFKVYTHNGGVQQTAAMWEAKGLRNITNDIIKANGYVPNASTWHANAYVPNNLTITRVENEVGYNGDTKSIIVQTSLIENGSNLMLQNSNLTTWNSDLSLLSNGTSMFQQCSSLSSISCGNLNNLTNGTQMFGYSGLTSFNYDLENLVTGDNMFYRCSNLTSFSGDLSKLRSAFHMFDACPLLTDVSFGENGLAALSNATDMFKSCSLNYQSLNNILNALPSRSGTIHITVADSVRDDLVNDENFEDVEIPAYDSGNYYEFTHSSGWTIRLTSQSGFSTSGNPYDVSEANGYIPDASTWNEQVYVPNNLTIVSVADGVAYDDLVY